MINTSLCADQQLTCNDLPDNPNPVYQWRHDHEVTNQVNSSLNLVKIKPTDFGLYYCWLIPSPYGSVVTQLLVMQQTGKWFLWGEFCKFDFPYNSCSFDE